MQHDVYHRDNGPTLIEYYTNECIVREKWFLHGKVFRSDGPYQTIYYANGQKCSEEFDCAEGLTFVEYYQSGAVREKNWHHEDRVSDKPSRIAYFESGEVEEEEWYLNSSLHRVKYPARILYHRNGKIAVEEWRIHDVPCREDDLPVSVRYYENGTIKDQNWLDGNCRRHRQGLPAVITYNEDGSLEKWIFYEHGEFVKQLIFICESAD